MDISAPVVFTHYTLETFSEKRLQGPEKQRNVGFKLSEPFSFRFQELKTGNARIQYALLGKPTEIWSCGALLLFEDWQPGFMVP